MKRRCHVSLPESRGRGGAVRNQFLMAASPALRGFVWNSCEALGTHPLIWLFTRGSFLEGGVSQTALLVRGLKLGLPDLLLSCLEFHGDVGLNLPGDSWFRERNVRPRGEKVQKLRFGGPLKECRKIARHRRKGVWEHRKLHPVGVLSILKRMASV